MFFVYCCCATINMVNKDLHSTNIFIQNEQQTSKNQQNVYIHYFQIRKTLSHEINTY